MASKVIHGKLFTPVKEDGTRDEIHLVTEMKDIIIDGDKNLEDRLDEIQDLIENSHLEDFADRLDNLESKKAPNAHASTATTYGLGSSEKYGHVKLSDTFNSTIASGNAANGVGASQNAVGNLYKDTATKLAGKAPTAHASTGTSYGIGNLTNYGHVRLSDTYSTSAANSSATNGVGASQNALYQAYKVLKDMIDTVDVGLTAEQLQKIQALLDANPISIKIANSKPKINGIWANTGTPIGDETSSYTDTHPVD